MSRLGPALVFAAVWMVPAACQRADADNARVERAAPAHAPARAHSVAQVELVDRVYGCLLACDDDANLTPTDRASCRLGCANLERTVSGECASTCIDEMVECWMRCDDIEGHDDRATCRLGCQEQARACVEDCSPA